MWRQIPALAAFWMSSLLSAVAPNASAASQTQVVGAAANWSSHGGGTDESGYSRLDEVNSRGIVTRSHTAGN